MRSIIKKVALSVSLLGILFWIFFVRNVQLSQQEKEEALKEFPSDWSFAQRAFPYGQINQTAYLEAMREAQFFKNQSLSTRGSNIWTLAGPTNSGGRITSLAIHPPNVQTIYVGTAAGGVFKTTNGGSSWIPLFEDALTLAMDKIDRRFTDYRFG